MSVPRIPVRQVSGYLAGVLRGRSVWVLVAGTGVLVWVIMAGRRAIRRVQEHKQPKPEHWSPQAVFATGFSSALVLVGGVQLCRPRLYPTPDRVFRRVLPMLRANREVRALVGSQLQPGLFRAYSHSGGLQWSHQTWRLHYQTRSLQLMFQVNGETSSAMVSMDVQREAWRGSSLHFKSLAVDLPTGERLLLKGSDTAVVFQGYTKLR